MIDYDPKRESWYSPIYVLNEFEKLRSVFGDEKLKDSVFQRALEMFTGAVALLGAYELSDANRYWLQSNNQTDTPDVMAGKQVEGNPHGIDLLLTQMEIVEMEDNAPTDDIVEFLKLTKLSSKKSYTKKDIIILTINRKDTIYDQDKVGKELFALNPKPTIYILGKSVNSASGDFIISTPYPQHIKAIPFNVDRTAQKYWIPERIDFGLSTEKEIKYERSNELKPVSTYEILGIDRNKVYKRFNIKIK